MNTGSFYLNAGLHPRRRQLRDCFSSTHSYTIGVYNSNAADTSRVEKIYVSHFFFLGMQACPRGVLYDVDSRNILAHEGTYRPKKRCRTRLRYHPIYIELAIGVA